MGFQIVPYVQVNGAYSIPDDVMEGFYKKAVNQGFADKVFYHQVTDSKTWLGLAKDSKNVMHVIWDDVERLPAMIAWLNNMIGNHALAHFLLFKEYWGRSSIRLGRMTIGYWFGFKDNDRPLFDVLIGHTPESNREASIYIRRLGMKVIGVIPEIVKDGEKLVGSIISYIHRRDFKWDL